jgi:hypothetical protein
MRSNSFIASYLHHGKRNGKEAEEVKYKNSKKKIKIFGKIVTQFAHKNCLFEKSLQKLSELTI